MLMISKFADMAYGHIFFYFILFLLLCIDNVPSSISISLLQSWTKHLRVAEQKEPPKRKILTFVLKNRENSTVKHSTEKTCFA